MIKEMWKKSDMSKCDVTRYENDDKNMKSYGYDYVIIWYSMAFNIIIYHIIHDNQCILKLQTNYTQTSTLFTLRVWRLPADMPQLLCMQDVWASFPEPRSYIPSHQNSVYEEWVTNRIRLTSKFALDLRQNSVRSIFIPAYSSLKQAVIPSALVFSSARSTFSDSNFGLTLLRNSMTSSLTTCSWIWFRCEAYS